MKVQCTAEELMDGTVGGCTACGELAYGVEPDARGYVCEGCGAESVYGLEELLLMGQVEFPDDFE